MVSLLRQPRPRAADGVMSIAQRLLDQRLAEQPDLDKIHDYWRGEQDHPFTPRGAPEDVRRLSRMSRVNILDIVVTALSQTLYVDGYREDGVDSDDAIWATWQHNKLDAEQSGVHESSIAYGVSYVTVLPGDPTPVIRGYSPRFMTALYGDDPDWPLWALAAEPNGDRWMYRLYDAEAVHYLESDANGDGLALNETREHGVGVTPVVRFRNRIDLDEDNQGEVEKLFEIQDQIDHTTFGLKVAEHFGAFKQRYAIGWLADSEEQALKMAADRMLMFEDADVKVGEFGQTDLKGYLDSRESAIRYASVISQIPPHYLLGQLVNLSAEALVASEASLMRKSRQHQKSFGESWEQALSLAARIEGREMSPLAQVRWADTESRAFSATVDALQKLRTLGVPLELLLERIPSFTQQDVQRAISLIEAGDSLSMFADLLRQQAGDADPGDGGEGAA